MNSSEKIDFIYLQYYKEKAKRLYDVLAEYYEKYYSELSLPEESTYSLNYVDLQESVYAYYMDVIKYKESHFCSNSNKFEDDPLKFIEDVHVKTINDSKSAALISKWLLKNSPMSINILDYKQLSDDHRKIIHSANACCVLSYIFNILGIDDEIEFSVVQDELVEDLLYHFMFRSFDHRHFIMNFNLLQELFE